MRRGPRPTRSPTRPSPTTPPSPHPEVYYFALIRPDGPAAPPFTEVLKNPAWDALRSLGHSVRDLELTRARQLGIILPVNVPLPAVVTLRVSEDGKSSTVVRGAIPLPTTTDTILRLPEGVE